MVRTIISLTEEEKAWVDNIASEEHVSMTAVIRTAIKHYRAEVEANQRPSFDELLHQTKGISKIKDGLAFQQKLRNEWDK